MHWPVLPAAYNRDIPYVNSWAKWGDPMYDDAIPLHYYWKLIIRQVIRRMKRLQDRMIKAITQDIRLLPYV